MDSQAGMGSGTYESESDGIADWDETLHPSAVQVTNWSPGYNSFPNNANVEKPDIGYHAFWTDSSTIQSEIDNQFTSCHSGEHCIVMRDQNSQFIDGDFNPTNRWIGVKNAIVQSWSNGGTENPTSDYLYHLGITAGT